MDWYYLLYLMELEFDIVVQKYQDKVVYYL